MKRTIGWFHKSARNFSIKLASRLGLPVQNAGSLSAWQIGSTQVRPRLDSPVSDYPKTLVKGSVVFGCVIASLILAGPAAAEEWPTKPVKIIIPFSAGGATDMLGRALALELGNIWKQPVIVENRLGAGGGIGADVVAKAPADGYTILLASGTMFTVNPFIYSKLPYSNDNFEMITKVASGPMVLTVNDGVPAKNMRELISYAKTNPGKLHFASAGNGSQVHIAGEAFADASGVNIVHVPYKGEGPAYTDLMAGVVDMAVGNINAISPLLSTGKIRALAVTGKERNALLPDVPTASEAGLPGFDFTGWFAITAPAGTPKHITSKIYADIQTSMVQPGMMRYLTNQGMTATISPSGKLKDEINSETSRWKALVAKRNITAN